MNFIWIKIVIAAAFVKMRMVRVRTTGSEVAERVNDE